MRNLTSAIALKQVPPRQQTPHCGFEREPPAKLELPLRVRLLLTLGRVLFRRVELVRLVGPGLPPQPREEWVKEEYVPRF